ncbi:MAG: hypothetical protein VCE12_11375 [Candidatus Latescibacterota bacterium]
MSRLALPFILLFVATSTTAQIRDLTTLQERRGLLSLSSDSLMSVRIRLVAQKDSLSARTESLWTQDPESYELLRTRTASRMLIARLRVIERRLDSLVTVGDSLDADLRDSYDWEISRLHGLLTEDGWDEGLFRQLLVFQEEREGLGNTIRASNHRFDDEDELSISAQDGPEELRQKIEYAQDRVAYYQERQREITRQLRFIDRQVFVMRKYWHVAEELIRMHGDGTDMLRIRGMDRPDLNRESPTMRGAQTVAPSFVDSAATPIEAPWLLEGQRLRARAQELGEVEAVLQERIGVFHEHLARILDGGE